MRAIIPIYNECDNILVKNKEEFIKLFKNSKNKVSLNKIIACGDAERLIFGYADNELLEEIKIEKENIIKNEMRGFELPGILNFNKENQLLIAGEYYSENKEIYKNINTRGYHRQKTRFLTENELKLGGENMSFSNILFKKKNRGQDVFLFLKKGSKLYLKDVIFDGISIVVEDGSYLNMENVTFKGGTIALIQQGHGIIESKNTYFTGIAYEYYFENLSKETAIGIIDFNNEDDIATYIRKSKVDNFFIYSDLDFQDKDILNVKTNINFINGSEDKENIVLNFKKINLSSKISAEDRIIISGEIEIRDSVETEVNIEIFAGRINVFDSKVRIESNIIPTDRKMGIYSENSELFLVNTILGEENYKSELGMEIIGSKVKIQNTIIEFCNEAILPKKQNEKDEDHIQLNEENENEISFNGLKINHCETLMKSEDTLKHLIGKELILENMVEGFLLKKCFIEIENFILKNIQNSPFSLYDSKMYLLGQKNIISNTNGTCRIENNSFVEMENINFSKIINTPAISVRKSVLITHNCIFNEIPVALHTMEKSLFVNDNTKFFNVKTPIMKEHGSYPQMDYIEYLADIEKQKVEEKE